MMTVTGLILGFLLSSGLYARTSLQDAPQYRGQAQEFWKCYQNDPKKKEKDAIDYGLKSVCHDLRAAEISADRKQFHLAEVDKKLADTHLDEVKENAGDITLKNGDAEWLKAVNTLSAAVTKKLQMPRPEPPPPSTPIPSPHPGGGGRPAYEVPEWKTQAPDVTNATKLGEVVTGETRLRVYEMNGSVILLKEGSEGALTVPWKMQSPPPQLERYFAMRKVNISPSDTPQAKDKILALLAGVELKLHSQGSDQVKTFTGLKENPELKKHIDGSKSDVFEKFLLKDKATWTK